MPSISTQPRSIVRWSPELATNVRRTIGYQAHCACGWEGGTHREWMDARLERRAHMETCPRMRSQ